MADINPDIWAKEITSKLFPDNSIVHHSKNDDKYATADIVKLPIAGALPDVVVNDRNYPRAPTSRVDTILEYSMDKLSTKPNLIDEYEDIGLSYPKRMDIQESHVNSLNTQAVTHVVYKWSPEGAGANIIRTTGGDRSPIVSGANGQRKRIKLESFFAAYEIMNSDDVNGDGRICFLPASMMSDLMRITDIRKKETYGIETLPSGVVARIMGYKIYYRSLASVYNNVASPEPVSLLTGTPPTTANAAGLFFHPDFVRKAFYNVKANIGQPDPLLDGGRAFNAVMKMGASPAYPDYKGIVSVVEAHV